MVVVGGGIAGCAMAYHLAQAGADVVLLEQGALNTQASGSNAGSIHAQIPHEPFTTHGEGWAARFAPVVRLLAAGIARWHELADELDTPLDVSARGGLLVARNTAEMADIARKARFERAQGLEVRLLDRAELRAIAPYLADDVAGGAFCPIEGKANPLAAAPAFARAARRLGARIMTGTGVLRITRADDGWALLTTAGTWRAQRVVNCAGAAAGRIAAMIGLTLPVEAHPIQVTATERASPLIPHLVYSAADRLSLKQSAAGTMLIGGGWPARLDARGQPQVDAGSLVGNLRVAVAAVPAIATLRVVRSWAAIVNGTPDWRPILGETPRAERCFLCFFPWMGFSAGPHVARNVARMVLGQPAEPEFAEFAPA